MCRMTCPPIVFNITCKRVKIRNQWPVLKTFGNTERIHPILFPAYIFRAHWILVLIQFPGYLVPFLGFFPGPRIELLCPLLIHFPFPLVPCLPVPSWFLGSFCSVFFLPPHCEIDASPVALLTFSQSLQRALATPFICCAWNNFFESSTTEWLGRRENEKHWGPIFCNPSPDWSPKQMSWFSASLSGQPSFQQNVRHFCYFLNVSYPLDVGSLFPF